jgi:hypothetical protein
MKARFSFRLSRAFGAAGWLEKSRQRQKRRLPFMRREQSLSAGEVQARCTERPISKER